VLPSNKHSFTPRNSPLTIASMSSTTTVTETPTLVTVTQQPEITAENVLRLFPEVNTDLIGGSHNSATNDHALDGYDEEQIRLMDEVCIVLDNNDIPIGSATKKLCECARGQE
jgi:isopentenyl-diphosphate delta-isomerase